MQQEEIYRLDTRAALAKHLFVSREEGFQHAPFEREIAFYESVRSGQLETVKTLFTPIGGEDEGFGRLSDDPLQNLKYHLVVSIAMMTRFCISGGLPTEEAYALSDVYIRRTDKCSNIPEISDVHYQATVEFTKRMRQVKAGKRYTKTMLMVLDYISDHLHDRILISDIAEAVSRSVPYISRMFRAEMGMTVSEYINKKKIETAAHLLQFSDFTALEISSFLAFSSQSYFIQQFKAAYGVTPKEYRNRLSSEDWMKSTSG